MAAVEANANARIECIILFIIVPMNFSFLIRILMTIRMLK